MRHLALFSLFACTTIAWAIVGYPISKSLTRSNLSPEEAVLNHIADQLVKQDPRAAAVLTRLRENKDIQTLALASAIHNAETQHGLPGVHALLSQTTPHKPIPDEVRLVSLAINPNRIDSTEARERFLNSHGSVIEILQRSGNPDAVDSYLSKLESAQRDSSLKDLPVDNAMALIVFDAVRDQSLRSFFLRETADSSEGRSSEPNWLETTLTEIAGMVDIDDDTSDADNSSDPSALIADAIAVASNNHPLFKQSIINHGYDATVYFLFKQFGKLIEDLVNQHSIPLNEVLEVIFANQDHLEVQMSTIHSTQECAAKLALLRNRKPAVWQTARQTALALRLNDDAPQHAEEILDRYRGDDIALLLYAGYENEIPFAAAALAKFDDIAVYILTHYADTPAFHEALVRPNVGPRLIPYVAKYGDQGLDRITDNQQWLDKYFLPDGTPRDKEWWTQLPGGAVIDVARNVANGHPNEWSELGWAAVDVADAALLVATLGSSATVTTAAKQGTKTVARKMTKDQVKKQVLKAGTHASSNALKGTRAEAKRVASSLLTKVSVRTTKLFHAVWLPAQKRWSLALGAVRVILRPVEKIMQAAQQLQTLWKTVSPGMRQVVYRSLLAVGLLVTLVERTLPKIKAIGEEALRFVQERISNAANQLSEGLNKTIRALIPGDPRLWLWLLPWVIYLAGLMALGGLSYTCFNGSPRARHV